MGALDPPIAGVNQGHVRERGICHDEGMAQACQHPAVHRWQSQVSLAWPRCPKPAQVSAAALLKSYFNLVSLTWSSWRPQRAPAPRPVWRARQGKHQAWLAQQNHSEETRITTTACQAGVRAGMLGKQKCILARAPIGQTPTWPPGAAISGTGWTRGLFVFVTSCLC